MSKNPSAASIPGGKLDEKKLRELVTKEVEERVMKAAAHDLKKEQLKNEATVKIKNQKIDELVTEVYQLKRTATNMERETEQFRAEKLKEIA